MVIDPSKLSRPQSCKCLVHVHIASKSLSGLWGVKRRETCIDTRCVTLPLITSCYGDGREFAPAGVPRNAAVCLPAPQCRRREAVDLYRLNSPSDTLALLGETISWAKWKKSRVNSFPVHLCAVTGTLELSKPYGKYSGALVA